MRSAELVDRGESFSFDAGVSQGKLLNVRFDGEVLLIDPALADFVVRRGITDSYDFVLALYSSANEVGTITGVAPNTVRDSARYLVESAASMYPENPKWKILRDGPRRPKPRFGGRM